MPARFAPRMSVSSRSPMNSGFTPPNWTVSLGTDPNKRDRVVLEAVNKGRIPVEYARNFAPELPWDGEVPQLEHQSETKQKISALLEAVTKPVQAEEEQL